MSEGSPLVSVVMINYNGLPWLKKSVCSVLASHQVEFELVVVDDCSTDDSRTYLGNLAKSNPQVVSVFLTENQGISGARNAGIEAARGTYVSLLDSDDLFLPDTLDRQIAAFERLRRACPDISLLTSDAWLINEAGEKKGRYISREWWDAETCENPPLWTLPSTFFFRRDHCARFHPGYRSADAPIFISRMLALGPVGFVGEPLIEYRLRMSSVTNDRGGQMLREMAAAEASLQADRLINPLEAAEVPAPAWRDTATWVHGRNAKNAAANGKTFRAARELIIALAAHPQRTLSKLTRAFATVGKRFVR